MQYFCKIFNLGEIFGKNQIQAVHVYQIQIFSIEIKIWELFLLSENVS